MSAFLLERYCRHAEWRQYLGSPSWTRTNDTAVNSRVLYRLSYGGIFQAPALLNQDLCWRYLSSRAVASQVLWAEMSLTTVFGMGTGGPSS